MHVNRFKNSFVASGVAGGDIGQKPTIVAPRIPTSQPVLPPPPPVAAPVAAATYSAPATAAALSIQQAAAQAAAALSAQQAASQAAMASQSSQTSIQAVSCFLLPMLLPAMSTCHSVTLPVVHSLAASEICSVCDRQLQLRKPLLQS